MTTVKSRRTPKRVAPVKGRPGLWKRLRRSWQWLRRQWSRVHGSVYCIMARDPDRPESRRLVVAYIGKWAARNWEERIRQHLYGDGGAYGGKESSLKPWASTVPGWVPADTRKAQLAAVRRLIADGTVFRVWHGDCFSWYLTHRETRAIHSRFRPSRRPRYNDLCNHGNRHRITKSAALAAAAARKAGRVAWDSRATGIRIDSEGRGERYGVSLAERVSGPRRWRGLLPAARERVAFYADWQREQGDSLQMCPESVADRKSLVSDGFAHPPEWADAGS